MSTTTHIRNYFSCQKKHNSQIDFFYPEKLKAEIANKLGALKKEEEKYILLV